MPPTRDSFAHALEALRRRLRSGVDSPGAPLPINLVAAELRLSPTPVREALSRLVGEELVEKRGPAYTRPWLDGRTLAELYRLRLRYLEPLAGETRHPIADIGAGRGFKFTEALASGDHSPGVVVEALMLELVRLADDRVLLRAFARAAERLAPFQPIEATLFAEPRGEALALVSAFDTGSARDLRLELRAYHRRRISTAATIARLAEGPEKYRPDII